ncbi:RNA 2',3'-cyclic phosphodiesterase [Achromobacter sp. MY14]|uniref:RNA 2',3'-cyclic phosphodiesterase n=1 Tax=unclassified Achromobacter TaxID=2626865 RepID=UPI001E47F3FF|nr:RNA 2',3'-cyclic phosphodiesterase [Achromobacter sp. MY14]MCD0500727.1 RNA 2',3'-cyclic phosphodiesterase [Achromobacter sp. MY14]
MSAIRLFFALWPSPPLAASLAEWAQAARPHCGGRIMRTETLHLTLAFLGPVEAQLADALAAATPERSVPPGELMLDRYGVFKRQRILWAGPRQAGPRQAGPRQAGPRQAGRDEAEPNPTEPHRPDSLQPDSLQPDSHQPETQPAPAPLQVIHDGLWQWLAGYGLTAPPQPFRPHVTLLRNIERDDPPPPPPAPLIWRYDRLVLVASESQTGGSRYRIVAQSRPLEP